ncbi:hypothetical protein MIMGU_mgv1a0270492mg, partial [Erythranthe guttata]
MQFLMHHNPIFTSQETHPMIIACFKMWSSNWIKR